MNLPGGHSEDAIRIGYAGETRRRAVVLERRSTGWRRFAYRKRAGEWVQTGSEIVTQVDLDAPAAVVQDGETTLGD
jgi:hypothetical protein